MNNYNEMVDTLETDKVENQPHPVNQITPVSKYLAMVLFVLLPFVGGYVGYQLAPEKVVEVSAEKQTVVAETPETPTMQNSLANVPAEAEHVLFEGRKTGYFIFEGKVYVALTSATEDTTNGDWDWIVAGPATLILEADADTFKVVSAELAQTGSLYAIDKNQGYSFDKVLKNVDTESVETFGKGGAFFISDKGLYIGEQFLTKGKKSDLEVYVINSEEGISPFTVYVHNKSTGTWIQGGFGLDTKEITAPDVSDLTMDLKLFP